jgi:tripartite-type tricarboxylate transporter receptor subunit TctC
MDFQRPVALPPGVPKDRIAILRKAYGKALKDPELLAQAKKSKFIITHVPGERVVELVDEILSMPPEIKKSLEFLVRKTKKR